MFDITCLDNLFDPDVRTALLNWTEKHPLEDEIIHLKPPPDIWMEGTWDLPENKEIVAGSAAVHLILEKLRQKKPHQIPKLDEFKAEDVDIFYLGRASNQRLKLGKTDYVQVKDQTVESLLLNFDLPVCRAAYNSRYEIWVSAQCLRAILTGKQYVPEYLKDFSTFWKVVKSRSQPQKDYSEQDLTHRYRHMFTRYQDRVDKYANRGCQPEWCASETILPWIKNRFHYSEWKEPEVKQEPPAQVNQLTQIENMLKQIQGQLDEIKQTQSSCESSLSDSS